MWWVPEFLSSRLNLVAPPPLLQASVTPLTWVPLGGAKRACGGGGPIQKTEHSGNLQNNPFTVISYGEGRNSKESEQLLICTATAIPFYIFLFWE